MGKRVIDSPIPVVYKQILKKRISGELRINGDNFSKTIYFLNGNLAFAKTSVIQERIGEILFKIGKINQEQFLNIKNIIKNQKGKLGSILIKMGALSQKDLFFGLLYQVRSIAVSVFTLDKGEWEFVQGNPKLPDDSQFEIDLPDIISEGIERSFDFSYYKSRLSHLTPIVGSLPNSKTEYISDEDITFLKRLKKYSNISNSKVNQQLRLPVDKYWNKIILYYLLNLVSFEKITVDKELEKNIEELTLLYDKLKKGKLGYYDIFGIKKDAGYDKIKNTYFEFAKKFHPDRVAESTNPEIKDKANFVFGTINKAYEIISNPEKRKEYDDKLVSGKVEEQENENLLDKARILYRKAITLHKQEKHWEATNLLEEAIRLDDSKASYYILLGMSQMNIMTLHRKAQESFQKAIELDPWNATPLINMGQLFEKEGMKQRADAFYKKALSVDPTNSIAIKKVGKKEGTGKKSFFSLFGKKK